MVPHPVSASYLHVGDTCRTSRKGGAGGLAEQLLSGVIRGWHTGQLA